MSEQSFYRPQHPYGEVIKRRLEELRGEQVAGIYVNRQRVTTTDTESTSAGDSLEQDNCIHCHATYGHKISCPKLNREAAEELSRIDEFFLKSLRISSN